MEQRTPEWFEARKGRLTASIAGAALGCAPYMSEDDAMRSLVRSMHDMESEFKGNIATEYGTRNEDGALIDYRLETGNTVEQVGFVTFGDWLGASPDGLVGVSKLLEIKCPFGLRKDSDPKFKSIHDQPHYYAQIQIQLFCTGRGVCDFFQWAPGGTMLEEVAYDGDWIQENLPKLKDFWQAAKNADPKDFEGPKRKVIDTPQAAMLVAEYDQLTEAMDLAKERRNEVLAEMVRLAGEKDAKFAGRNLTLTVRKGSVSYAKALAEYAPDADLEKFRGKPSQSWGLR